MRTETFHTPEPPKIRIAVPSGSIHVDTEDVTETTVEVVGPNEDDMKIELHRNDLVIEATKKSLFGSRGSHEIRVVAPHRSELDANVASADVEGRGTFGEVEVNSASGDVSLDWIDGRLHVNTASGDVDVRHVQADTRINSASGDVRLAEAEGDVRVRTASGDVELLSVVRGKVEVQSASGDVMVGIRQGSSVYIDASSMSGDMSSELEVSDAPPASDGPSVDFRARTMSGDVVVRRA
jgi:DUF4097 and DUF4098 domain-containing protein YvlB